MAQDILEDLKQAILDYNKAVCPVLAQEALDAGVDPIAVMDALIEAVKKVGDDFGEGVLFLPDLVGASDALQAAAPVIENAIKQSGRKREALGTVVIGTVAGDIHTIGKSMVASLLMADGFEVRDVGVDVPAERFIEAIREYDADILGMSALLTTTAPQCQVVINRLAEVGLRDKVRVMVGGGAITAPFAQGMGADGYKPTAPGAVALAREWMNV